MKKEYKLSRDAVFCSAINGLIGYAFENDKERFEAQTFASLSMLMPKSIKSEEDASTVLFIHAISNITGLMEIEAKALELMRLYHPDYLLKMSQINLSSVDITKGLHEHITPLLVAMAKSAGVQNLQDGFNELEEMQDELEL